LSESLGQQVVVDNRPGAAGNIGTAIVAKAPPDGYTLLQANNGQATNVTLYRNLPFDVMRDFTPVTQICSSPAIVVVHPSLPVKSISDLVRLAKAKPGAVNYASGGSGTFTFLAMEIFKAQAGVDISHVPYRSGGLGLTSVIAGETSVYFSPASVALQQVRDRRLRPLAVTSVKRLSVLPEIPTVAESGYPKYQSTTWYGVMAPAKTPKETIAIIHRAAMSVLNNPAVRKRFVDLGLVVVGDKPEEFAVFFRSEIEVLGKVIRDLNLTAD
jgi:tripartite-type tricarboxylate transporter receptor subunit TctC